MMKLSKYEKETIINWNEAEDTASIYTGRLLQEGNQPQHYRTPPICASRSFR